MTTASEQEAQEEFARDWLRSNHEGYPDPEWSSWAEAFAVAFELAREERRRMLVWRTSGGAWRVCSVDAGCSGLLMGPRR